jgi:hypothetical protein
MSWLVGQLHDHSSPVSQFGQPHDMTCTNDRYLGVDHRCHNNEFRLNFKQPAATCASAQVKFKSAQAVYHLSPKGLTLSRVVLTLTTPGSTISVHMSLIASQMS